MNCEEAEILISGHLDHENTEQEEMALQAHLRGCARCQSVLRQYQAMDAQLETLSVPAPAQLLGGTMYKVRVSSGQKTKKFAFGRWSALCAAAALLLVIGVQQLDGLKSGSASVTAASAGAAETARTTDSGNDTADMAAPSAADAPAAFSVAPAAESDKAAGADEAAAENAPGMSTLCITPGAEEMRQDILAALEQYHPVEEADGTITCTLPDEAADDFITQYADQCSAIAFACQ